MGGGGPGKEHCPWEREQYLPKMDAVGKRARDKPLASYDKPAEGRQASFLKCTSLLLTAHIFLLCSSIHRLTFLPQS